jgi:Holliday junction resolvasome RuvABC endonuclease subunit
MTIVIGLDISSTCIGYSVLNIDANNIISIIKADYIKPIKIGTIIERLVDTRDQIQDLFNTYKPDYIGIEDLIKFMPKTTATTVTTLSAFNRIIALTAYDSLNTYPGLFSVMAIRHGLKLNKIFPKKEEMPDLVAKHLGITFPYRKNKKGKIIVENYDIADGIAVGLYYCYLLIGRIKQKVVRVPTKRKGKKK